MRLLGLLFLFQAFSTHAQYCWDIRQIKFNRMAQMEGILFGDNFESLCWKSANCNGSRTGSCSCWSTKDCKSAFQDDCIDYNSAAIWCQTQLQNSNSAIIINDPTSPNNYCLKLTWVPPTENHIEPRGRKISNTEKKAHFFGPSIGKSYKNGVIRWYSWKTYFPENKLSLEKNPFIMFQIHGRPDIDAGESYRRPLLRISSKNGRLSIGWSFDPQYISQANAIDENYQIIPLSCSIRDLTDRWTEFVLITQFDYSNQKLGFIELYVDKEKLFSIQNVQLGYNDKHGPYPGWGMYWYTGDASKSYSYYLDDIRIGSDTSMVKQLGLIH